WPTLSTMVYSAGQRGSAYPGPQSGLDRAVDEAGPAVGEIRARQQDPAVRSLHRGVVVLVPAGTVDRPGPARELIFEPVVGGRPEHLVAGKDAVELALHPWFVLDVRARRVKPEADQQLSAVIEQLFGCQVAERMAGPDR